MRGHHAKPVTYFVRPQSIHGTKARSDVLELTRWGFSFGVKGMPGWTTCQMDISNGSGQDKEVTTDHPECHVRRQVFQLERKVCPPPNAIAFHWLDVDPIEGEVSSIMNSLTPHPKPSHKPQEDRAPIASCKDIPSQTLPYAGL